MRHDGGGRIACHTARLHDARHLFYTHLDTTV
jgi:hypothetical protein